MKQTKNILITFFLLFTITTINAQEVNCKCGVLIGNAHNTDRQSTIVYSKVFDTKCKKKNGRLRLDNVTKEKIKFQFFNYLSENHPKYLKPFKLVTASAIEVWIVTPEETFEQRINRIFVPSSLGYTVKKISDFNLKLITKNWNETDKNNNKTMRDYLSKLRNKKK